PTNNPHITAYVVLKPGVSTDVVRLALGAELPDYMVPAVFVCLEALPLTLNGKLDLQALAALQHDLPQTVYQAPVTDLQKRLAEVWAHVLKVDQVGLHDNFFTLGGHSLLATQIISRARRVLGTDVALRTVFETASFGEFCAAVALGDPSSTR
ncbi:phosphopantetheine-binding protein, partial [Leclercia adecarboxylata]|uniref:phosphopantetheine-binding protein n=1 Tax=Leclercia adecarboxylata TaxID=83655 RepID=UPI00234C0E99